MLSSEILEKQFGPTKLIVLKQNDQYRIIQTVAVNTSDVLELSLVTFDPKNITTFPDVHQVIMDGESIGKAYKKAGINFIRDVNSVSKVSIPKDLAVFFNSSDLATIIEVDILVGPKNMHYCHILEIYNPLVNWPKANISNSEDIFEKLLNFAKLLSNQVPHL